MQCAVANCPSQDIALLNQLFLHRDDYSKLGGEPEGNLHVEVNGFVYIAKPHDEMKPASVGMNSIQRRGLAVSLNDQVTVVTYGRAGHEAEATLLSTASIEADFVVKKAARGTETMDGAALVASIVARYTPQYLSVGQIFVVEFQGEKLLLKVGPLEALVVDKTTGGVLPDGGSVQRGMLCSQTQLQLSKAQGSPIAFTGLESQSRKTIFKQDFSFSQMGIGGLDKEFSDIFRRAFASRIFPASVIKKLGVKHVKGMLLYGPPGTGKTLIARQIGKMLNGKEPKIVNGPEVLSKYVGQSEENIRNLFAEADAEYAERGDDSDLHIIIFDEIDSVCKQRGSSRDGTGVGDTVVNQLLSKIDGVNSLNNILVIGMTNRKDMIDDALLRPGRLEVQVEISLPDEEGRHQILKIHTTSMREADYLDKDVSLPSLAAETKNFSGAEIEGLVKSAASYAFARQVQVDNIKKVEIGDLKVSRADFERALTEVRPAFGASTDDLSACVRGGILHYGPQLTSMLQSASALFAQLQSSERTSLISILLEGKPGTGKTALAASLALQSGFPFIKLVSPNGLVGMTEAAKAAHIARVFDDAHKSPLSLILLDDLERLLEYVRIGPRFSNIVLQTLLTCVKRTPRSSKLVVLATSSSAATLEQLELLDAFNVSYSLPPLGHDEALAVLRELGVANVSDVEPTLRTVSRGMPVKKLMLVAEMALVEGHALHPARFAATLQETGLLD